MTAFALLFTLASIGLAETSYLIRKRRSSEHVVCVIGNGCGDVLTSKYKTMFGVHNDLLGFLFYGAMMATTALYVIEIGDISFWSQAASIMLATALFATLRFVYLQWRVLEVWCFWCIMSATTIGLMAIISFL